MAGVLTRVLAHRTERDPESRESGYLPSFVNLKALLRLSRICLSRMESAVSEATFSFASTWRERTGLAPGRQTPTSNPEGQSLIPCGDGDRDCDPKYRVFQHRCGDRPDR